MGSLTDFIQTNETNMYAGPPGRTAAAPAQDVPQGAAELASAEAALPAFGQLWAAMGEDPAGAAAAGVPAFSSGGSGSSGAIASSSSTRPNTPISSVSIASLPGKPNLEVPLFRASGEIDEEHFARGASSMAHKLYSPAGSASFHVVKVFCTRVQGKEVNELFYNEVHMLTHLKDTGVVPLVLGSLSPNEFPVSLTPKLVLEDAGLNLGEWMYEQAEATHATNGERLHTALFVAVERAVDALHDKGVIHGDLSPSNIRAVGPAPSIKIIDFDRAIMSTDEQLRAFDHCAAAHACNTAAEAVFGEYWDFDVDVEE